MKISNSKKELARIISENGGWRDEAESSAQCADGSISFWYDVATKQRGEEWCGSYLGACADIRFTGVKLPNWHQTILSREEYFYLYPAPDADGWIEWKGKPKSPVGNGVLVDVKLKGGAYHDAELLDDASWSDAWGDESIIAYRPHKPNAVKPTDFGAIGDGETNPAVKEGRESMEYQPTIEQLAADYQAKLDIATRAQEEADAHRCGAEVALSKLEIAVKELGFKIELVTAKQDPELVITDWRDLQAGDVISVSGGWWEPGSEYTVDENDGSRAAPIRVGGCWAFIGECSFKFIRRP